MLWVMLCLYENCANAAKDKPTNLCISPSLVLQQQSFSICFKSPVIFFSSGMEHHIRQLVDVCLPHLVLHAVDGEGPEALRHAVFSLHGGLRQPANSSAVHFHFWEHERRPRVFSHEEKSFPLTFIQGLGDKEFSWFWHCPVCYEYMQ